MSARRVTCLGLLLFLGGSLLGCGKGDPPAASVDGCAVTEIDIRAARLPRPIAGLYWGQEIWVTYKSDVHQDYGVRSSRSRDEALELARSLCRAVHGGEDIGVLARKWSNGMGGLARGFAVVPEPSHRDDPDARDVALMMATPGALTPLIEWRGGFWFARRIPAAEGRALAALLEREMGKRAKARVIHIHHQGAFPRRYQFDDFTKEQAITKAWALIREIQNGADFEELARLHNNDRDTRARGGLLTSKDPRTGEPTEWIRWADRRLNQPLLDVILEKATVGTVWPEPVVSGQGVDVVLVLARETGKP